MNDLFISFFRLLHRKLREWHQLGPVVSLAWSQAIRSDLLSMQSQTEQLGIYVRSHRISLSFTAARPPILLIRPTET